MFNDFAYIDNVIDYKKLIINTEEIFYTVNQEGSDQVLISVDNISKDCFKLVGLDGNPNNTITSIDFEIDNETQYGTITLELENLIDEPTFLIWDSDYVCEHGLAFTTFLDIKNVKLSNTEGAIVAFYDGNWYDRPEGFSLNFEPREYDMPNDNVVYTIKSWKGLDSIPSDLKPYFRLKNVVQPWDNSTVTHPRPTTAYFESIEYIRYEEGEDEDEVDQIIFVIEPGNLLYGGMIIPSPELNNRWGLNYQPYEYDFEPFLRLRYNKYYDNYDGNWTIMGV